MNAGTIDNASRGPARAVSWLSCEHHGRAEIQGRDGEAFAIGIILVVIGVILAILAAPAPAIAGRRHCF